MIYVRTAHVASGLFCGVLMFFLSVAPAHAVFINEIHYDNVGSDIGEGVEVSGEAGADLSGWSLVLYNGGDSSPYSSTIALSGVFVDLQNGMGVLDFGLSGIQNGGPDGIALVDSLGVVIQFLSYEGSFTADSGVAAGMTSNDIGVAETSSTPLGYSLQLTGIGREYADFSWATSPIENSFGNVNYGQTFSAAVVDSIASRLPGNVSVPAPPSLSLFLLGLFGCFAMKGRVYRERPLSI